MNDSQYIIAEVRTPYLEIYTISLRPCIDWPRFRVIADCRLPNETEDNLTLLFEQDPFALLAHDMSYWVILTTALAAIEDFPNWANT